MQRTTEVGGLFLGGNPETNTKGTIVTAAWLNAVQEELAGVVEGLGGSLNPPQTNQVLERLNASFALKTDTVPAGTIINFAGTTAPPGYLICPTAAANISRAAYAALFAAIGTTWGNGDGSTTFGLPWFPADYAAIQAAANVGTSTVGQVISHNHDYSRYLTTASTLATGATSNPGTIGTGTTTVTGGSKNTAAGVRMLLCVKY